MIISFKKNFWLGTSLCITFYFGLISIYYAFSRNYLVQDDARQHVVWLQKYIDPQLFPNDLIANYFTTLAPVGYKFFYWLMARFGIEPVILAKVLPLFLGLIATVYIFKFSLKIFHNSFGAFLISWLFNQVIWLNDDLISATPRAFVYPLFAAFLYYLSARSLFPLLISLALQGLFYPQLLLVEIATLTVGLLDWNGIKPRLTKDKENYIFWLSGLIITFLFLLPILLERSQFSTIVTPEQMKVMPEFGWQGRNQYFGVNLIQFLLLGNSGIKIPLFPSIVWLGFALPFLLKSRSPLIKSIAPEIKILWQIIIASLGMFFLAHIFLPKLHLPSRYTHHSFRFVMPIAAGIVLLILLEFGWQWLQRKRQTKVKFKFKETIVMGVIGFCASVVIIFPMLPPVFLGLFHSWIVGNEPAIYQFLAKQPKDILVASLAPEIDNIPAFSQRSILVGREFSLAYHPNYYNQMKERAIALINAQYSSDLTVTKNVINKYGIDFLIIERHAFDPNYLLKQEWLIRSSFKDIVFNANDRIKNGEKPALEKYRDRCTSLATKNLIVLDTACLSKINLSPKN
jgi:hypothetical protein